ncbi:Secreted protein [Prescottella defluvii]|uniref:hypothetical protein n=1 Tax=Prescottella defluvii TaxID=1323361 RepID=UPI00056021EC|nr:hypothetical protein [Prescottella defluvii]
MRKSIATGVVAAASVGIILGGAGVASAASKTIPEGPGTYLVNKDIRPGIYTTQGAPDEGQTCSWMRGERKSLRVEPIASGKSTGPATVKIEETDDVFVTVGCGEWKMERLMDEGFLPSGSLSGSLDIGSLTRPLVSSLELGSAAGALGGSVAAGSLARGSAENGPSEP